MIIVIQGSKNYDSYDRFISAMRRTMHVVVAESKTPIKEINLYSVGPAKVNNFVTEFSNKTEDSLKARGIKIRFHRVPPSWVENNIDAISYFAYLSNPDEPMSPLAKFAEGKNVELGWFTF